MSGVQAALEFLSRRPVVTAILALVYSVVSIATHERVNLLVRALQGRLGREGFVALAVVLLASALGALVVSILRSPRARRGALFTALLLWCAGAALAYRYLFTVVSESVHYFQYAGLTLLLFALCGRRGAAMLWTNLVGFLDEANQYWVLHPDWGIYLDWNDIVLNALGALLGGLVLAATVDEDRFAVRLAPRGGRPAVLPFALTLLLVVGGAALVRAGKIALYAAPVAEDASPPWLVLDRGAAGALPFWMTADWAQKRFHVLPARHGAALVTLFAGIAFAVDLRRRGGSRAGLAPAAAALALVAAFAPVGARAGTSIPRDTTPAEPPRRYAVAFLPSAFAPPAIDGADDEAAWALAPWSEPFVDIRGGDFAPPIFETRFRALADAGHLYLFATLEEPRLYATLTAHDSVIFHDPDFELFVDPEGDGLGYFELEVNALATTWDLRLDRPYREGGRADDAWELAGLRLAVRLDGSLNDPRDSDVGWTVEMALPWSAFTNAPAETAAVSRAPARGTSWRVNFSRVQWPLEIVDGRYRKVPQACEDNWVWSPQGVVDMHRPERWGYFDFGP